MAMKYLADEPVASKSETKPNYVDSAVTCPDCGAVADYGHEQPHRTYCPMLVNTGTRATFFGSEGQWDCLNCGYANHELRVGCRNCGIRRET
jgi:Zn finger protein HypA/HybF involved in hydrogenase expression